MLPNVTSNNPCTQCPCNVGTVPYFDFRPSAKWIEQIYTVAEWLTSGWNQCEIFKIIGVTNLSIYPDWMHDKNLGTDKVTASCTYSLGLIFVLENLWLRESMS